MEQDLWLGLDLGTTGVKCIAYDDDVRPVASSETESPPDYLPDGIVEQDPEVWWQSALQVMQDVLAKVDPGLVRGISISSQGITIVPVDATGLARRPAISWLDARGQAMLARLAERIPPDEVEGRTGKSFRVGYSLALLAWLAEREPESLAPGATVLMPMDYLVSKLTGTAVTDQTMASGSMYYNLARRDWDDDILAAAGVSRQILPPVRPAGTAAGSLLPEVVQRLGLAPDVVVAVGGQDQKCAAYGAGLDETTMTLSLGTSAALSAPHVAPGPPSDGFGVFAHVVPGQWIREAAILTAGAANRWFASVLGTSDFAALSAQAAAGHPAESGPFFFPHLSRTERGSWPVAPGGVFWGLGLDAERADLVRAVMEGVAFEIGLACPPALATAMPGRIRLFGGGVRSPLWCQMIADATGTRVEALSDPQMAAAGAARLARRAAGRPEAPPAVVGASYEPTERGSVRTRAEAYRQLRDLIYR